MLKLKLLIIVIVGIFILPAYAELDEDIVSNNNDTATVNEQVQDNEIIEINDTDKEILNKVNPEESILNEEELLSEKTVQSVPQNLISNRYKKPISKRKIIKKFLLAMGGVLASSIIIYAILALYNRIRLGLGSLEQFFESNEDKSLDVPEDVFDAVNKFIDKTKWE